MLLKRHCSTSHRPDEQGHILSAITKRSKGVFLMNEPVTKMDTRFSDPDGVVTPWDETRRVLETSEVFWLSTVRADGRPHVTPLVAVWYDGALYFTTPNNGQKAVNLRG